MFVADSKAFLYSRSTTNGICVYPWFDVENWKYYYFPKLEVENECPGSRNVFRRKNIHNHKFASFT